MKTNNTLLISWRPKPKLLLKTLGHDNLVQVGMLWNNRDEVELAITEESEMQNRRIVFKRDSNRL